MQSLPDTFIGFLLLDAIPRIILLMVVLGILWISTWIKKSIRRGLSTWNGTIVMEENEWWIQIYNSYIRNPNLWARIMKLCIFLVWGIGGVAVGLTWNSGILLFAFCPFLIIGVLFSIFFKIEFQQYDSAESESCIV